MPQQTDSTSYIYSNIEEFVPLRDDILNFKYLDSKFLEGNGQKSGKLKSTISKENAILHKELDFQYNDVILFILIILVSILAFVRISRKNYLHRISTSILNYSYSNSFFKEKNLAYTLNNNLMIVVFYVSTALVINVLTNYFEYNIPYTSNWQQLFIYLIFVICANVFYRLSLRVISYFSDIYDSTSEFLFFFANLNRILGIVYLIMLFGLFFTDSHTKVIFIYLSLITTILAIFIKYYRILVIFFRNRFSLYYMILYFCALEIIPIMLLLKVFTLISESNFTLDKIVV